MRRKFRRDEFPLVVDAQKRVPPVHERRSPIAAFLSSAGPSRTGAEQPCWLVACGNINGRFLKSHGLDEFHEVRFLFFDAFGWAGQFEEPCATVFACPSCDGARILAGDVDSGKSRLVRFQRDDIARVRVSRREAELLSPPVDVAKVITTVAGKGDDGNIDLPAAIARSDEAGVAHGGGGCGRPIRGHLPLNLRLVCHWRGQLRHIVASVGAHRHDPF